MGEDEDERKEGSDTDTSYGVGFTDDSERYLKNATGYEAMECFAEVRDSLIVEVNGDVRNLLA